MEFKMKKVLLRSVLLLFLTLSSSLFATEINHSMGIGLQYSGIVGYQVSMDKDKHRFRGAIGVLGIGAGYDYFLHPKWSMGVSLTETIRTVYSVNINYYANTPNDGFRFGLDLGHMPDTGDDGDGFFNSDGSKDVVWLSVGYAF